ncbi:A24 family peptidase [Vibrio hyugaensis]|uniref:A24 family peptidase n=1 Tax=Vibrio hyugaensis TaxID=1534743 RepID=UPI0005F07236|nr:prepilin peptidase [Vibrio hyugaensis]
MTDSLELFLYAILLITCLIISISDVRDRRIENKHVVIIAIVSLALGFSDYSMNSLWYLGTCWAALIFLHRLRVMGGGDVKLIAAFSLSLPFVGLWFALWLVGIFGGVLAVFYLAKRSLQAKNQVKPSIPTGLPYGIAICSGFYVVLITRIIT